MADPICRWRNTSIKQVAEFTQVLPHAPMPKDKAREFVEQQWHEWDGGNDFFRTPYQLAAQLGLYYEDDDTFYPRFDHVLTIKEARDYVEGWIRRYYVPNPYTGSIRYDGNPIVLNSQLYESAQSGESDLDEFFKSHLNIELGNKDILSNILNNFSDIKVDNGVFSVKNPNVSIGSVISSNSSKDKKAFFDTFNDIPVSSQDSEIKSAQQDRPHQLIHYGAPGTGKSHKIKQFLEENNVPSENIFRTTFHPDSDYSTFVGAYKPTKGSKPVYGLFGDKTIRLNDGGELSEETITYKFIPQAFLLAYIQAYKKPNENVYLVVEEINRGNCAQIFGDLFQLLDRDENGKSEYTIKADTDLKNFLIEEFGEENDAIKSGELCLPSNLYIWATMNTSDMSLYPIDSAFKRRFDWEYEPIKYNHSMMIDIDGVKYSWVDFQRKVNDKIWFDTRSEDKMMGDYFVNPHTGIISKNLFLNKVLFYLWNDVCKDGDTDIFPTDDDFSFSKLYADQNSESIHAMMEKLGVKPVDEPEEDDEDESVDDGDNGNKKRIPKYSINGGQDLFTTPKVVQQIIKDYATQNPNTSVDEMIALWNDISKRKDVLVANWEPSPNDNQPFAAKRRAKIEWEQGSVWVLTGWTETIFQPFIKNVKSKLGITIDKVE